MPSKKAKKLRVLLAVPLEVHLDPKKLVKYGKEIAERWRDEDRIEEIGVEMVDLVAQAGIDGDIELPEEWEVDDLEWNGEIYSMEDLREMAEE